VFVRGFKATENQLLNLEEWAILCCKVGAAVAEEDVYGVKITLFLERICADICGDLDSVDGTVEVISLESFSRELHRMIDEEASRMADGKKKDYVAAFNLFDLDSNGFISNDEFRKALFRLKLSDGLPESQIPAAIALFDHNQKGYINVDDFVKFVDIHKKKFEDKRKNEFFDDENDDDDNDDDDGHLTLASNTPPVTITSNKECDWLCWFLWRRAYKVDPTDPESVITELEANCNETEIAMNLHGSISSKELWNILTEMKLRGDLLRNQFDRGIVYALDGDTGTKNKDRKSDSNADTLVDYEALCRYIVRMGRAFYAMIQQKKADIEKKFPALLSTLKKEFMGMLSEAMNTRCD
jgi:hypothetical protein